MTHTSLGALPWDFDGTVFRCAWEYPVAAFGEEVRFHTNVLGMSTLANNGDYALFISGDRDITYACRRATGALPDLSAHRLTLMTGQIERMVDALRSRTKVDVLLGSPAQRVLRIFSPAGLQVDIWEFPASEPLVG